MFKENDKFSPQRQAICPWKQNFLYYYVCLHIQVERNMKVAQNRDAVVKEQFYFAKNARYCQKTYDKVNSDIKFKSKMTLFRMTSYWCQYRILSMDNKMALLAWFLWSKRTLRAVMLRLSFPSRLRKGNFATTFREKDKSLKVEKIF